MMERNKAEIIFGKLSFRITIIMVFPQNSYKTYLQLASQHKFSLKIFFVIINSELFI